MKRVNKITLIVLSTILIGSNSVYAESFNNLSDVQNNIYDHLKNRDKKIEFTYLGDENEFKNGLTKAIEKAYRSDDYTERSWVEIKPEAISTNGKIETTINVSYLTTQDQEKYVDNEVTKIISNIIIPEMNDIEKVKTINNYLISKLDYDFTLKSNNPYDALTTGKCTCQGYSMLAYKLLTCAGFESRIIVGTFNGEPHSWNYIKIKDKNKWYHLDVTNNDSTRSNKYFLVADDIMQANNYSWNKINYLS